VTVINLTIGRRLLHKCCIENSNAQRRSKKSLHFSKRSICINYSFHPLWVPIPILDILIPALHIRQIYDSLLGPASAAGVEVVEVVAEIGADCVDIGVAAAEWEEVEAGEVEEVVGEAEEV